LTSYVNGTPKKLKETDTTFNPTDWWIGKKTTYHTLYQYALDTLSCPAMPIECERVFSSAKKLLTPERNQLTGCFKACGCLKARREKELIQPQIDQGGSELCGGEVDSFNSRVSSKVIGNGNGNASSARAKFVHNGVRTSHSTAIPGSTAPFPNPEIYPASYPRRPSPPSPMRVRVGGRLGSAQ
jgi:hypothetical protein